MPISFKPISENYFDAIVSVLEIMDDFKIEKTVLESRLKDMFTENYECIGFFDEDELIGICGLWYMTRHYSGKSVELDHVFVYESHRNKGIGKLFFNWLYGYLKDKKQETIELNTYVTNHPSHKFYYNEGFKILGYHFLKKL